MKACCEWAEKTHNKELEAVMDKKRVHSIRRADLKEKRHRDLMDEVIQKLRDAQVKLRSLRQLKAASGA